MLTPFEQSVAVPGLAPGNYIIDVDLISSDGSSTFAPGVAELYVHQRRVPYVLLADSWFMNDCPHLRSYPRQAAHDRHVRPAARRAGRRV